MKVFELYFSDLTPAAQKEWVDTFGEKPLEFIPMYSFEVDDYYADDDCDDEPMVDAQTAWERFDAACHEELDGGNYDPSAWDDDDSMKVDGFGPECAPGEEVDVWL